MKYKGFAALWLLIFSLNAVAAVQHYGKALGHADWEVAGNALYCQLKLSIPRFGEVIFRQKHADTTHFILQQWEFNPTPTAAKVYTLPPVWKKQTGAVRIGTMPIHSGHTLAVADAELTAKLLKQLQLGKQPRIVYQTHAKDTIKVDVAAEGFMHGYQDYLKCVAKMLPFSFDEVKFSTVHFARDDRHLDRKDMNQLRRIAKYVKANKNIQTIKIDGYSDNVGRNGHNIYVSELRAKAVAEYFKGFGVDAKKLEVSWHGSKNPMADNRSHYGRDLNRRVSIELLY